MEVELGAGAMDARLNFSGTYSAWLTKVKGEGARARWLSSTTKRYFTIDYTSQLFFYAQNESQKQVSHPIRFKDIVSADQLPDAGSKSEHPFGFSILTAERTYELFTHSYQDAELWVSALNAARDIANGKAPGQAPSSTRHSQDFARPLGTSSTSTSDHNGGDYRGEDGRAPWEPPPVTKRWMQPAPVQQEVSVAAPPPPPVDPFAALDALEELAGPAPEDVAAPVAPELQGELLKEARARVTGALTSKRSLQEIEAAVAPPPWRPEVEYHVSEEAVDVEPSAPAFASSPDVVVSEIPLATVAAFAAGPAGSTAPAGIAPPAGGIAPPAGMGGIAPPAGFGAFTEATERAPAVPAPVAATAAPTMAFAAPAPPEESWDDPPAAASAPLPPQAPEPPSFGDANPEGGDLDDLVGELMAVTSKEPGSHRLLEHFHCISCDFQVLMCEDYVWTEEVDYMFFRNNYPDFERLRRCLARQDDCIAYCCQCSWKSARTSSSLQEVADGLRWRKIA